MKSSTGGLVKLEPRIAPGSTMQHNETLVRAPAAVKAKAAPPAKAARQRIVRLEDRIAPGVWGNHNETLVREPAEDRPPAPDQEAPSRRKLQVVKLEERIAPRSGGGCDDEWGCGTNHNEMLVRDWA